MSTIPIGYFDSFKQSFKNVLKPAINWLIFFGVTVLLVWGAPKVGEGLAYLWGLI